jgi:hypothetical protein
MRRSFRMSGKIELKARVGLTLKQKKGYLKREEDPTYYPEATLIITGEDGTKITISPSYQDLCNMLLEFRKHEIKVDYNMKRNNYTSKFIEQLEETIKKMKQIKLSEFEENEEIYKLQYRFNSFKEAKEYFKNATEN